MPLVMMKSNETVGVIKVVGNESYKKRLAELGFVAGAIINIISNNDGDIILELKGSKLAITKEMSQKILVTKI